jgi:hypothetical protein
VPFHGDYCAAANFPDLAAILRSITVRQLALRFTRCFTIQAVTAEMFGMSELQRRKASPVHICCASALKAKLAVGSANSAEAKTVVGPNFAECLGHGGPPLFNPTPFVSGIRFGTTSRSRGNGFVGSPSWGSPTRAAALPHPALAPIAPLTARNPLGAWRLSRIGEYHRRPRRFGSLRTAVLVLKNQRVRWPN